MYQGTMLVEGALGEEGCVLKVRGKGSYDEKYELQPNS